MHTSDGRDIIKVHSGVAITEPFVTLLVEINWARGHVAHEYTVLLDPPVYTPDQSQAAAPVAAPAVGASPRGGAIQREPAAAPAPAAQAARTRRQPPAASAAPATAGQTYQVQRGDTLSRIAAHEAATTSRAGTAPLDGGDLPGQSGFVRQEHEPAASRRGTAPAGCGIPRRGQCRGGGGRSAPAECGLARGLRRQHQCAQRCPGAQ